MKRPLAIFGACFLLAHLLAVFMPQASVWALAAFLGLFGFVLLRRNRGSSLVSYSGFIVAASAVALALLLRGVYLAQIVQPLAVYTQIGRPVQVTAVVLTPELIGAGDYMDAVLQVERVGENEVKRKFFVQATEMPATEAGERVSLPLVLGPVPEGKYQRSFYADGIFVTGEFQRYQTPESAMQRLGKADTIQALFVRLRAFFSAGIRRYLPYDTGAIAAAMCTGDKTELTSAIRGRFRSAGFSHALVVSGLHLSVITAAVYGLLRGRAGKRAAALACCGAALVFTCFAGATPSLVRACVAVLLLYGGQLIRRQSDALTSLAASAVLLCVQNPFAAVDVGLLLSYSATLGVLYGGWLLRRRFQFNGKGRTIGRRAARSILSAFVLSVCATAFTLPVIMAIDGGISLLGVFCNVLAVPLLGVIVSAGLVLALCAGAGLAGGVCAAFLVLARIAGFVCGVCVNVLDGIARFADSMPYAMVYVSGTAAVCTYLALMTWVALGYFTHRRPLVTAATGALFLVLCGGVVSLLDLGVVRVSFVGAQQNPSAVVTQGPRTLVLYRGADNGLWEIQRCLQKQNRHIIDLLLDLRTNASAEDTEKLAQTLAAREAICVEKEIVNRRVEHVFYDIMVAVHHQKEGNAAVVNVDGYTFGMAAGKVDFSRLPPMNLYAAGSGRPRNLACEALLLPDYTFLWEDAYRNTTKAEILHSAEDPQLVLRSGRSVLTKNILQE